MAFKAIKNGSQEIVAFSLNTNDWKDLKKENTLTKNIILPCCNSLAVLKISSNGLHFFAHYSKKGCNFQGESIAHLMLKKYIYEFLKDYGYNVEIEKNMILDDVPRRPDIYLEINDLKIAIEVQNSIQNEATTIERSQNYINNNIIVVWLYLFPLSDKRLNSYSSSNNGVFIYHIDNNEDDYILKDVISRKEYNLKDFLLAELKETLDETYQINMADAFSSLICKYDKHNYYLEDYIKINNSTIAPVSDCIKKPKKKDIIKDIFFNVSKGFKTTQKNITILVENKYGSNALFVLNEDKKKRLYITGGPEINETNLHIKKVHYSKLVLNTLNNTGWESTQNKIFENRYEIDIFSEFNGIKIAFLFSYFCDPNIQKTIEYCKENSFITVVLDMQSYHKYENVLTIELKNDKDFIDDIENILIRHSPF